MKSEIRKISRVNYNYATISLTQGRLNKGLLALPKGLSEQFPQRNQEIQIYLNESPESQIKPYSSYNSSTHECRINGLRDWFHENDIKSGDEIVIQFLDKKHYSYRLIPEKNFVSITQNLQKEFDVSKTEKEASKKLNNLADWTQTNKNAVSLGEFGRLANAVAESRQFGSIGVYHSKEAVPANLRTLLSKIYHGHCQVCDFWFLKKDNEPYFEVHHLDSFKGHYPKNIVVVCGNCHNQFEYAKVSHEYDANQWLIKVTFNKYSYVIKQALSTVEPAQFTKEVFV